MSPRPDLGPKPQLGYTANPIERTAERRDDAAFLTALEGDPRAGAYAIGGELVILNKTRTGLDPLFAVAQARALGVPGETVFLGLLDGAARFGVPLDSGAAESLKTSENFVV